MDSQISGRGTRERVRPHEFVFVVVAASVFVALASLVWIGFLASDDSVYLDHARAWIDGTFTLPTMHWGFRYPLIGTIAAAMALFGDVPSLIGIVTIFFAAGLFLSIFYLVDPVSGRRAAFATILVAALAPITVVRSTFINADILEVIFVVLSIGCFTRAFLGEKVPAYLFASGVFAGIAFLTRETAAGLMVAYFILFLAGAFFDRRLYLWGALGWMAVEGLEVIFFLANGEGPLYRLMTVADSHGAAVAVAGDELGLGTGNVSTHRVFGPILALFVNQEFGLLYYYVVPAAWTLLRNTGLQENIRKLIQLLALITVVWFIWIGYGRMVPPLPNYFMVSAVAGAILVGLWLYYMPNKTLAWLLAAALLMTNVAALSVENTHPRFASRILADYVETAAEPVYTDQRTYTRTRVALRWSPDWDRDLLKPGPPASGALYFLDPDSPRHAPGSPSGEGEYQVVRQWPAPRRTIGHVVAILRLESYVPESIRSRLLYCGSPVELIRISSD